MRDPDRIDEILELISKIWHKHPDLRLCQLICNCFPNYLVNHQSGDSYAVVKDLYYIEDDELQDKLERKY